MQEKYQYKYYQNVVINWQDFYDRGGYKLTDGAPAYYTNPGDVFKGNYGLIPFECDPDNIAILNKNSQGMLDIFFNVTLNPPNFQPKRIEIKNINASLTATQGYLFELSSSLIRYPIQFLDSLSTYTNYEEYTNSQLKTTQIFNLKRSSGSNPLTTNIVQPPYLINPSLAFTIVYDYF